MGPKSVACCLVLLVWWCGALLDVVTGDSLYSAGDGITNLNVNNFEQTLANSQNGWIVEFYATWCGHCQRFAPIYKQYANDIADWSGLMRVAAVACSDPINLPVCRSQHIYGFPSVKFYPANMQRVARGHKLTSLRFSVDSVRTATVRFLEGYVLNPRDPELPNLNPHRNLESLKTVARDQGADTIIAIVEDERQTLETTELAKTVILDMSEFYPEVVVARITTTSFPDHQTESWRPFPALVAIGVHDDSTDLVSSLSSREDAVRRIKNYVSLHQAASAPTSTWYTSAATTRQTTATTSAPWMTSQIPQAVAASLSSPNLPVPLTQDDMDSNIYYTLWNEVAARSRIRGRALPALKAYIQQLAKYHPGNERLRTYLEAVHGWLQRIGGSLDGRLYINTVEGLQNNESYVKRELDWSSCRGSEDKFRGYPCSLWMTFHALTVGAYENYLKHPQDPFDPMSTLGAIRQYVRYFLGCRECAQHFLRMARYMEDEVSAPEDVVLWLWKGHNRANNRLHGDETEDPNHPKVQFPGPGACPQCRHGNGPFDKFNNETEWNENEVLQYLRNFYTLSSPGNFIETSPSSVGVGTVTGGVTSQPPNNGQGNRHNAHHTHRPPTHHNGHDSHDPDNVAPHITLRDSSGCSVEDLPWGECSVTCGTGVSVRMSNNNSACRMEMDTRLCQVRPCDYTFDNDRRAGYSRTCSRYSALYQDASFTNMTFNNCTTTLGYRWRYCGPCPAFCCPSVRYVTMNSEVTCIHGNSRQQGLAQIAWVRACTCTEC